MSFFAELKRRNVVRVGIAYVLMGWVLLQGADFAMDLIGAPNWVIQALSVVVAIGLPFALFLAWAFELTPEGIKRDEDVDRGQSTTPRTGRKLDILIISFLAVVIVIMGVERFFFVDQGDDAPVAVENAEPSSKTIAVLPFVNMSSNVEQEYFSDGITEEILNRLAKISDLQVTARTSTFSFKGKNLDVREVAKTLGVDNILEGSVRRDGEKVRITAQLIRAEDGFHLWSETYDRKLESVFAVQDEISGKIAEALQVSLGIADTATDTQLVNPEAYDLYLHARSLHRARGPGLLEAIRLFEESLAIDPDFAPAWAGLAQSLQVVNVYVSSEQSQHLGDVEARSMEAATRALELDPGLPVGLHAMANAMLTQYRWIEAETYFDQAMAADPDSAAIMEDYAHFLWYTWQPEAALPVVNRMIELDPMVAVFLFAATNINYAIDDIAKRNEYLEAALAISPDFQTLNSLKLAQSFEQMQLQQAHEWVDQMPLPRDVTPEAMHRMIDWTQNPSAPLDAEMQTALSYHPEFAAWAGRDDLWAETVWNKPVQLNWENPPATIAGLISPANNGFFRRLISHPSTHEAIQRINLPEYWRENGWPEGCEPVGDDDFKCFEQETPGS